MDRNYAMDLFQYRHLPEHLQEVSEEFYTLAMYLYSLQLAPIERTVALRKLLEAKDAAVRARVLGGKEQIE
jgi:hypothetical protein